MHWAFLRGASGVWLRHLRVNKEVCDFLRDFPEEMQVGFWPGRKIERKRLIHDYNIERHLHWLLSSISNMLPSRWEGLCQLAGQCEANVNI